MIRRLLAAVILLGTAIALLIVAWPNLFGVSEAPVVAQLVSVRALTSVVAITAALLLTLIAIVWSAARRFCGALAVLALLFATVNAAVLSTRGFTTDPLPPHSPGDITVLAWNTLGDAPGVETIAALTVAEQADVVVLPETSQETAVAVAERTREAGRPMWVYTVAFDKVAKARSTSVLVSVDLGQHVVDAEVGNTNVLPSVVLRPLTPDGFTIIGVHPVAPIPSELDNWRADLRWVDEVCTGERVILAGDLNATADHFRVVDPAMGVAGLGFGDCLNAGLLTGSGAVGTWPTRLPPLLGAPIDHVFVSHDLTVTAMRVLTEYDEAGSDHRPVVARLRVN